MRTFMILRFILFLQWRKNGLANMTYFSNARLRLGFRSLEAAESSQKIWQNPGYKNTKEKVDFGSSWRSAAYGKVTNGMSS